MLKKSVLTLALASLLLAAAVIPVMGQDGVPQAVEIFNKPENELAAEYADKPIKVQGVVAYAGPNMYGLASVYLSEEKGGPNYAMCVLPYSSSMLALDGIMPGQMVTVSGEYRGKHAVCDGCAVIKECSVVSR